MFEFSQKTKEELQSYVYALIDPRDNRIFYIGKGNTNRIFSHENEATWNLRETQKLEMIRSINNAGLKVNHYIIRHGLEDKEAFLLESVFIDFLTFKDFADISKITNIASGHYSFDRGIKTVEECELLYNCEELKRQDIQHNILVININKTYDGNRKRKNSNPVYNRPNIYEATRGWWVLDKNRAQNSEYVLAEYRGIVRAVFKPQIWLQDIENRGEKRWGFEGFEVVDEEILNLYLNKEVPKLQGTANPIRYFSML